MKSGRYIRLLWFAWLLPSHNSPSVACADYKVLYQWKTIDYDFPSSESRQQALANGSFIPLNNVLTAAKVWRNRIYFSVGRYQPGVPVSLASDKYAPNRKQTKVGHKLRPFPNWALQELGNCDAFQFIQMMEIDQFGRMWIIDSGRVNLLTPDPSNKCLPKLFILDLNSRLVLRTHIFPATVSSPTEGFLDDLVVACLSPLNCFAYITNPLQNVLIVYDFRRDKSWAVEHSSMNPDPAAVEVTSNGITYSLAGFGIDGVAISPIAQNFDRIYFSPVTSLNRYSVSTQTLKGLPVDQTTPLDDDDVTDHGTGISQADGLAMDSAGLMYYGRLANNTLAFWDTKRGNRNAETDQAYRHSNVDMEYIAGINFDNRGNLVLNVNKLGRYMFTGYEPDEYNTRVVLTQAVDNRRSYMYG